MLRLGAGSGKVAEALLGGCRYRRAINGDIMTEPEPNRDLAVADALGNALARLVPLYGEREQDVVMRSNYGRAGGGGRNY